MCPGAAMTRENGHGAPDGDTFTILDDTPVYNRYMTVYNRRVQFPSHSAGGVNTSSCLEDPPVHEFDVVGHPKASFHFCISFPYHPPANGGHWSEGEVTMIREYAQGPNEMVYGLPAGSFHEESHKTLEGCAMAELSEEAHLCGGKMYRLLDETCPGIAEVKWCRNRFTPFIVYDPQTDEAPGSRDSEEVIEIQRMKITDIKKMLRSGNMLLPSVTTCYWAFEWLDEHYHHGLSE
eukprot:jgi/Picre1/34217/NNA_001691.t1